jgi:hypothetical protein
MDGISWTDLDPEELDALANLRDGFPTTSCDPIAVLTLRRIGLVKVTELTPEAKKMLTEADAANNADNNVLMSSWWC